MQQRTVTQAEYEVMEKEVASMTEELEAMGKEVEAKGNLEVGVLSRIDFLPCSQPR